MFVLPGVKVQIPNRRNEDGTCKNIIFTNDSVKIWTEPNVTRATGMWLASSGVGCSDELYYYSKDNINKNILDNTTRQNCKVANVFATNGKITSFEPYTVDSVVNSNASNFSQAGRSYLSGLSMPSNKYINLTLGASGSTYTAPANGWLILNKAANSVGQEIRLTNQSNQLRGYAIAAMNYAGLDTMIPCRKGDTIHIYYSAAGSVEDFRFVYAEGEQNV